MIKEVRSIIEDKKQIITFAQCFVPDCIAKHLDDSEVRPEKLLEEALFSWYDGVYQKKNGGSEPRRALAEMIYEAGQKIWAEYAEEETFLARFEIVAKVCFKSIIMHNVLYTILPYRILIFFGTQMKKVLL